MDTPELHGDGHWAANQFEGAENNWDRKRLNKTKILLFGKKSPSRAPPPVANRTRLSTTTRAAQSTCDNSAVLNILECPICLDTLVQASILNCGHMYCHRCIIQWQSSNNWCPICQRIIGVWGAGEPVRVYLVDHMIESFWTELSPHVQELILEARKTRMANLESQKNAMMPKIYRKIRMIRIYFGTKGFWRGLTLPFIHWFRNSSSNFEFSLSGFIKPFCLLMIGCLLCCGNCGYLNIPILIFDFFAYLIHCIWMYPGWSSELIPLTCGN